jgi:hypothetical protein
VYYEEQQNSMNLRDYLEQHEKELTERIASHRRKAIPFEAELAEIRSAINALTPAAPDAEPRHNDLRRYLAERQRELIKVLAEIASDDLYEIEHELDELQKVKATIGLTQIPERQQAADMALPVVGIPYQSMTIKDLVVTALALRRPRGATLGELLDLFRDQWGRDIDRASLSPQLSRLFSAGQITQFGDGRKWYLLPPRPDNPAYLPYRKADGEVLWMIPNQAREGDLPGKVRELNRPVFD